eukprot:6457253-Pyramimonas_sp.AAC.2
MPRSSGMYALGRGSAVVLTPPAPALSSAASAANRSRSSSSASLSRSMRNLPQSHSPSAVQSDGQYKVQSPAAPASRYSARVLAAGPAPVVRCVMRSYE